jgi:hypothetical protein
MLRAEIHLNSPIMFSAGNLHHDLKLAMEYIKEKQQYIDSCKEILIEAGIEPHGLLVVVVRRAASEIKTYRKRTA